MGRTADDKYRISANSLTEIQTAWDDATTAISRAAKDRDGYAIPAGHQLNGVILWLLRLPAKEREHIVLEGVTIYIDHLDSDVKKPIMSASVGAPLEHLTAVRSPSPRISRVDRKGIGDTLDRVKVPKRGK